MAQQPVPGSLAPGATDVHHQEKMQQLETPVCSGPSNQDAQDADDTDPDNRHALTPAPTIIVRDAESASLGAMSHQAATGYL